jgi:hypothetical protein
MECCPPPGQLRHPTDGRLPIDAHLRREWIANVGYRYEVLLNGDVIVCGSRDPEHDAARALRARRLRGRFRAVDFRTGTPRMILDIDKAARLRTVERGDTGLIVVPHRPMSEDVRAVLGAHTSPQGCVDRGEGGRGARQPAEAADGETCAGSRRIPEPA